MVVCSPGGGGGFCASAPTASAVAAVPATAIVQNVRCRMITLPSFPTRLSKPRQGARQEEAPECRRILACFARRSRPRAHVPGTDGARRTLYSALQGRDEL